MILAVRMVEQESKYFIQMEDNSGEYDVVMQEIQTIKVPTGDPYEGEYNVMPSFKDQVLETSQKLMKDDVTVYAIQVSKVGNLSGGNTVYIGGIF